MRSHFGMALVVTALGAIVACSSSSGSPAAPEAGGNECTDTIVNVFNNNPNVACPVDANGNPVVDATVNFTLGSASS